MFEKSVKGILFSQETISKVAARILGLKQKKGLILCWDGSYFYQLILSPENYPH